VVLYSETEYNRYVTGPLTTRGALLQLLRQAPDYGSDLIRRFAAAARHRAALAPARVYPVLKELEGEGLVRATRLAPGGDRGARARIYYILTRTGEDAAERDRKTLESLLAPLASPPVTAEERRRMAERIIAADELSEAGAALAVADR
jgi:DNA-binding PadR family transcriptional regulator